MPKAPAFLVLLPLVTLAAVAANGCGDGGGASAGAVITAPVEGAEVTLPADKTLDIAFSVTNFTLMAPGSCAGAKSCGHAHLNIDGDGCNGMGMVYNAAAAASPIKGDFKLCPAASVVGAHALKLTLHDDNHVDLGVVSQVSITVKM